MQLRGRELQLPQSFPLGLEQGRDGALSSSCSRCCDHFFRSRALRRSPQRGSPPAAAAWGTRRAKGVPWRYRPHPADCTGPSVPAGDARGTRRQTRGGGSGCGSSNTGNWAVHFTWRQEPRFPQQTVVKAGFGGKSNGVVKTDQYPRVEGCYQPRRPQASEVPLYQWGSDEAAIPATPYHPASTSMITSWSRRPKVFLPSEREGGGCGPHSGLLKPCQGFPPILGRSGAAVLFPGEGSAWGQASPGLGLPMTGGRFP